MTPDPRIHPYRLDIAADFLKGRVDAKEFVSGTRYSVSSVLTGLYRRPDPDAPMETQLLKGEGFTVYEEKNGWAWGQAETDGYVGFVPIKSLSFRQNEPTYRVNQLRTFLYRYPDMKKRVYDVVSLNARVYIEAFEGDFARTNEGFFIFSEHLSPITQPLEKDYVAIAERFSGTPYLWGGKSSIGIDCSGLVQTALTVCNVPAPRDADMQEKALGESLQVAKDFSNLQRGDLIFWKGHVALMVSPNEIFHATAFHMSTFKECFFGAEKRIRETKGEPITSVKRLNFNIS